MTGVIKGKDGTSDAVYEVLYDSEEEAFEVDNLQQDFDDGCLKFIDV